VLRATTFSTAVSLVISLCLGCVMPPVRQTDTRPLDFIELTIDGAHQAIGAHRINCEQLTRRYIKRIRTYDQATRLNAIIYINPNAARKVWTGSTLSPVA